MAKIEWGIKRMCQACGVRFYDLQKTPIICPKCQAPYEIIAPTKGRRGRQAALDDSKMIALDDLALQDTLDLPDDLTGDVADPLIEDTDDLDEGLDDVVDVMDHDHKDDH
jgi:uncharacterized protein (TIGR02300 family)